MNSDSVEEIATLARKTSQRRSTNSAQPKFKNLFPFRDNLALEVPQYN